MPFRDSGRDRKYRQFRVGNPESSGTVPRLMADAIAQTAYFRLINSLLRFMWMEVPNLSAVLRLILIGVAYFY
jgi:hypothetical protein